LCPASTYFQETVKNGIVDDRQHRQRHSADCRRLSISPKTVKDRLGTALYKFHVTKRIELRVLLASLDFSTWDNQK